MSLSHRTTNVFLALYKKVNQTGILNAAWAESAFVSSYFMYKKYLEDSNAKLVKNYPQLFQGGHILDIGANIGYTAYVFSKALTASYQVFAFEPEARNVKILKKVATAYHFLNKLVITAAAVGDREGEIELWQNDNHHADHRVLTEEFRDQFKGELQVQKVPVMTVDHFLQMRQGDNPVSFIKIDVQGYELAVCRGMEKTLAANPNCVVWLEYCPSIMSELGYRGEELIQFFRDKNYSFYQLNKNNILESVELTTATCAKLMKNSPGYIDILCSQRKFSNIGSS